MQLITKMRIHQRLETEKEVNIETTRHSAKNSFETTDHSQSQNSQSDSESTLNSCNIVDVSKECDSDIEATPSRTEPVKSFPNSIMKKKSTASFEINVEDIQSFSNEEMKTSAIESQSDFDYVIKLPQPRGIILDDGLPTDSENHIAKRVASSILNLEKLSGTYLFN